MVKLSFKLFGCLTVFLFLSGVGIYLAVNATVPAPRIDQKVIDVVYPLAVESAKAKFQRTVNNVNSGYPRQSLVFGELEANAFLFQAVKKAETGGKYRNFPIKNPYIYFYKDAMRVRFDLALREVFWLVANQFRGMKYKDNLMDLDRRESGSSRITITVDFELFWLKDHPEIRVKRMYVGVLPLPFTGFVNQALDPMNKYFRRDFNKSAKMDKFRVRQMRFEDKEFVADVEAMVTPDYMKDLRQRRLAQEAARRGGVQPFSNYLGPSSKCTFACSEKEQQDLMNAVNEFNKQNTLDEAELRKARRIREQMKQ